MATVITSISDSIRSGFAFSVDKFPLAGPDGMRTPHYGLFRSDDGSCVGSACRATYNPHTVDDIVALADAAQTAFGGDCQVSCHFSEGHNVSIAPSKDYRASIFGTDTIWPRLIVSAGYDGRAFQASLGVYRDVCKNLAMMRQISGCSSSIKHTEGMRFKIGDLVDRFRLLAQNWTNVLGIIRAMDSRTVDLSAFVRSVYPLPAGDSTARSAGMYERKISAIFERVIRERAAIGRPSLDRRGDVWNVSAWEAFNGVQGFAQHDSIRRGVAAQSRFGRAIAAFDDSAVDRALELALVA